MSDKEQRIRVRAYAIWEGEGRHDGRAEEHWRQAELEIEQALRSAEAQAAEAPEQRIRTARLSITHIFRRGEDGLRGRD